jgi:hypothetical protein
MLEFFFGRASERKLRLFACHCCRPIWPLLTADDRRAVEVSEQFSDGLAGAKERDTARYTGSQAAPGRWTAPSRAAGAATFASSWSAACHVASHSVEAGQVGQTHCDLVREIVGNPFRPAAVNPAWLAWNGSIVGRLTEAAYQGREQLRPPVCRQPDAGRRRVGGRRVCRRRTTGPSAVGGASREGMLGGRSAHVEELKSANLAMSSLLWARQGDSDSAVVLRPGRVLRVGRARDDDLQLFSRASSHSEAEVTLEGTGVRFRNHSEKAFYINGERGETDAALAPGDEVRVYLARLWLEAPPTIDPAWLAWNGGVVQQLAEAIFARQDTGKPPLLADALEDAGCGDARLLGGLRGQGGAGVADVGGRTAGRAKLAAC